VKVITVFSSHGDSFIPGLARFTLLPDKRFFRRVSGATSCGMTKFSGTIIVEVHGLEVVKLVKVGEEQIPTLQNSLTDGSVKSDDSRVLGFSLGCKLL
jgi:hypothetical protein